jgi:hypothetical protein
MLSQSKTARIVIAAICVYACAGRFAFDTMPLSSRTPAKAIWYHHPAIVVPGVILTLPTILIEMGIANLSPHDGGATDRAISAFVAFIDPVITIIWCVAMFFLLNRVAVRFESRRSACTNDSKTPQSTLG